MMHYITTLPSFLWPVKLVFIAVSLIFIVYTVYSLCRTHWFKFVIGYGWVEFFTLKPFGFKKAVRKWHKIRHRFARQNTPNYHQALFDAHYVLEDFLDDIVIFFQAVPLSQRLRHIGDETIRDIEKLRAVVTATESLKEGGEESLTQEQAIEYLETYHRAFHDLGIARD